MRRFRKVGLGAMEPVQIIGGPRTRAIIQRPPDMDRPGAEYKHPNVTCRVDHASLIQSGQVIRTPGGEHFLVTDHSKTIDWRTHHLFMCDREVTWARPTTTTDTVTRLPRQGATPTSMGTLWVMWERVRREFLDLNVRISQETHLIATGADIHRDDLLDGMKVTRVDRALGVQIVELMG